MSKKRARETPEWAAVIRRSAAFQKLAKGDESWQATLGNVLERSGNADVLKGVSELLDGKVKNARLAALGVCEATGLEEVSLAPRKKTKPPQLFTVVNTQQLDSMPFAERVAAVLTSTAFPKKIAKLQSVLSKRQKEVGTKPGTSVAARLLESEEHNGNKFVTSACWLTLKMHSETVTREDRRKMIAKIAKDPEAMDLTLLGTLHQDETVEMIDVLSNVNGPAAVRKLFALYIMDPSLVGSKLSPATFSRFSGVTSETRHEIASEHGLPILEKAIKAMKGTHGEWVRTAVFFSSHPLICGSLVGDLLQNVVAFHVSEIEEQEGCIAARFLRIAWYGLLHIPENVLEKLKDDYLQPFIEKHGKGDNMEGVRLARAGEEGYAVAAGREATLRKMRDRIGGIEMRTTYLAKIAKIFLDNGKTEPSQIPTVPSLSWYLDFLSDQPVIDPESAARLASHVSTLLMQWITHDNPRPLLPSPLRLTIDNHTASISFPPTSGPLAVLVAALLKISLTNDATRRQACIGFWTAFNRLQDVSDADDDKVRKREMKFMMNCLGMF